jgi:hypothetical protein
MAVYAGVLKTVSGGRNIEHRKWRYYQTLDYAVERVTASYVLREFIDLGDVRLVNVRLSHYMDEVLKDSIGQEVTLNCGGGRAGSSRPTWVFSMRTDRGRIKPGLFATIFGLIRQVLTSLLGGIILALFVFFAGWFGVVNLLIALGVLNDVPATPDEASVHELVSVLYHYIPFDVVLLGTAWTLFYFCLLAPVRGLVNTFRLWVAL